MAAAYTKLNNGSWGIRADGKLADQAVVTVTKKDGSTKTETVARVLWSGTDSKTGKVISLCTIESDRPAVNHTGKRIRRNNDGGCSCYQCRSGSECLCIYGNG